MKTELLNHKLRHTWRREAATFEEEEGKKVRSLRLYSAELLHDSRRYYNTNGLPAMGLGEPRDESDLIREIPTPVGAIQLRFDLVSGTWLYDTTHGKISVAPTCDTQDAAMFIENFLKLPEIAVSGGFKLLIGVPLHRWERVTSVARADPAAGEIAVYNDPENGHLIACGIALATQGGSRPIDLHLLILHEMVHLLEPVMEHWLKRLTHAVATEPDNIEKTTVLNEDYLPTCIKIWRQQRTQPQERYEADESLAAEILAEALTNMILDGSSHLETGWTTLDTLLKELEVNHTQIIGETASGRPKAQRVIRTTHILSEPSGPK